MFIIATINIFVFLFGLCIGSFLNCVIYRLEQKKDLSGRSFCPHCRHTLSWKDLFPVLSYLSLGGKCRYCKKKISIQYPIVEIFTGLVFVLIFSQLYNFNVGSLVNIIFLFYITSVLIIIFVYDLKHYLIPDKILFPAIILSFVYRIINITSFLDFFYASLIGSIFFLIMFLISKGKWMGFGDVKLAILMGLVLGIKGVLLALFLAFLFGAVIGTILIFFQKKGFKSEIPFAPFLVMGTFLAMIFSEQIISWYLNSSI
jgi:prepilin signal peptidase PulO-like enzyme (type II secretory pathway)